MDTPAGKNTVGAFHPPALVVIDPATLTSLPTRELRAGLAEVIKHGVIADAAELERVSAVAPELLARTASPSAVESLIERSVRIKAHVVATDEREHGLRKVLNFGHTIGHGVEAASCVPTPPRGGDRDRNGRRGATGRATRCRGATGRRSTWNAR